MKNIQWVWGCAVGLAVVGIMVTGSPAQADYESEKNAEHMGAIERALDKFAPDPAIFDGNAIVAGVSAGTVTGHFDKCNNAIMTWNKFEKQVSAKGKATDRFKTIVTRMQQMVPHCKKLHEAAKVYVADVQAKEQAAAKAKADVKDKCQAVYSATLKALGINDLHDVLDTASGGRTPATAEHVVEFRGKFEKLVAACKDPAFKDAPQVCKGQGMLLSSDTNKRYDYGDLCAPAADPVKTMTDIATRLLNLMIRHGSREAPTAESFRKADGWIHDTNPIYYASYFLVNDETKKAAAAQIKEAFGAAGVAPPADMSVVWAHKQAYLDALKQAVDATAAEWQLSESKCSGYACALAKTAITKAYKGASVKAVYGRDWKIAKNTLDIPTHRYQGLWVVFKVKGEDYCQVRSFTAHESYKGGGKYQKAKGAQWGYVRFQKKC